jgi:hypothetical protein
MTDHTHLQVIIRSYVMERVRTCSPPVTKSDNDVTCASTSGARVVSDTRQFRTHLVCQDSGLLRLYAVRYMW